MLLQSAELVFLGEKGEAAYYVRMSINNLPFNKRVFCRYEKELLKA